MYDDDRMDGLTLEDIDKPMQLDKIYHIKEECFVTLTIGSAVSSVCIQKWREIVRSRGIDK